MSFFQKHVFICTNQKEGGKQCCENEGASTYWQYSKQRIQDLGLAGPGGVRVNRSGCLGRCELGPCLVIYPEGVWYTFENTRDIDEIIENELILNRRVTRLMLDNSF